MTPLWIGGEINWPGTTAGSSTIIAEPELGERVSPKLFICVALGTLGNGVEAAEWY
jgi:hypothetical protein